MNETDVVKFDFRSCVYTTHTVYVCNDPNKKKSFPIWKLNLFRKVLLVRTPHFITCPFRILLMKPLAVNNGKINT